MKVNLNGEPIDIDTEDHFNIQDDNLDYELCRQGRLLAYYGTLAAQFEAQARNKKAELDRTESHLDLDIRAASKLNGEKLTENQIRAKIRIHGDYMEVHKNYIESQKDADTVNNLWKSIYLKTGLLRSMKNRQDAEAFTGDN